MTYISKNTWINCPMENEVDSNRRLVSWFVDQPSTIETTNYARQRIDNTTHSYKGNKGVIFEDLCTSVTMAYFK